MYYCYFIICDSNHTYIGITNDLHNRILQHNKIKKGGAKATSRGKNWRYHTVIGCFENKSTAQSFEWNWKHQKTTSGKWTKTKSGMKNKMSRLIQLLLDQNDLTIVDINKLLRDDPQKSAFAAYKIS
jgi:predicted GIY-YIG superfamily endonuclease